MILRATQKKIKPKERRMIMKKQYTSNLFFSLRSQIGSLHKQQLQHSVNQCGAMHATANKHPLFQQQYQQAPRYSTSSSSTTGNTMMKNRTQPEPRNDEDDDFLDSNPFQTRQPLSHNTTTTTTTTTHSNDDSRNKNNGSNNESTSGGNTNRMSMKFVYAFILVSTTLSLGIWQTRRYLWKVDLIASRKKTLLDQNPIELITLNDVDGDESQLLYKKVVISGQWMNDQTVLIGTRQSPVGKRMQISGRSAGETGYYIITPFKCDLKSNGTSVVVFVNRGWIPKSQLDQLDLFINTGGSDNKQTITGVVREYEKPGYIEKSQYRVGQSKVFLVMDPSVIAQEMNMQSLLGRNVERPLFIDQLSSEYTNMDKQQQQQQKTQEQQEYPMRAIPDDYLKFYVMPETHIAYMTMWYTLSAWILGVAYYMRFKKRRW